MCRLALVPVVAVLALIAPLSPLAPRAAAVDGSPVSYEPPVEGPIVDPFRPPPNRWDSGNRGVDYATEPGSPVKAAADGEVVFAGLVGGRLHVVLLHPDGIRTSYSFVESIVVHRGDRVRKGDVVAHAGDRLHFGARVGGDYIDPTTLFDNGPPKVFLVPDEVRRPGSEIAERAGLANFLGPLARMARGAASAGITAVKLGAAGAGAVVQYTGNEIVAAFEELRGAGQYANLGNPINQGYRLVRRTAQWWRDGQDCTPGNVEPPPLPERRVAVLVDGLGSNSDPNASIDAVDAPGMGYVATERFSYTGGTTAQNDYDSRDTAGDLREMGRRMLGVLKEVHRDHPGVAVDILARDQGGLVARTALTYGYDPHDARYPTVANLITLGSPHTGADLATAVTMVGFTDSGQLIEEGIDASKRVPVDLRGESIHQMSETSWFLTQLNHTQLPEGIRFTSIGARGDWVVPAVHTNVNGARNVVVSVPGLRDDHSDLPGSEAGRREVALAAAGLPPTCETFGDMLVDYYTSNLISTAEDLAGGALYAGARKADKYVVPEIPVAKSTRRTP